MPKQKLEPKQIAVVFLPMSSTINHDKLLKCNFDSRHKLHNQLCGNQVQISSLWFKK